jgi:hypothetical protein
LTNVPPVRRLEACPQAGRRLACLTPASAPDVPICAGPLLVTAVVLSRRSVLGRMSEIADSGATDSTFPYEAAPSICAFHAPLGCPRLSETEWVYGLRGRKPGGAGSAHTVWQQTTPFLEQAQAPSLRSQ